MNLYVARHGQTFWNAENKVCGRTDVLLNETGIMQAGLLAEFILVENIILDFIISSPLKRALKTAEMIGQTNSIEIVIDNRLIEQNYGIYEGVDRKNVEFQNNKRKFAFKYPGGESTMQVVYRIYGLLEDLKQRYPGKNILIISHGGVCRIINTYFEDVTNEEFYHWQLENAKLMKYVM